MDDNTDSALVECMQSSGLGDVLEPTAAPDVLVELLEDPQAGTVLVFGPLLDYLFTEVSHRKPL